MGDVRSGEGGIRHALHMLYSGLVPPADRPRVRRNLDLVPGGRPVTSISRVVRPLDRFPRP